MSASTQLILGTAIAALVLLVAAYAAATWYHGRCLRAAREPIAQFWRGLEKALVDHHQAAEDVVRAADAAGALRLAERERAESAVASATLTGSPAQRARREAILHEAMAAVRGTVGHLEGARSFSLDEALVAYTAAWAQVDAMGKRYNALVAAYNRMARNPAFVVWVRRRGHGLIEAFEAPSSSSLAVDVL